MNKNDLLIILRRHRLIQVGVMLALVVGVFLAYNASARADGINANVLLRNPSGEPVGVVKLTQDEESSVMVRAQVNNLPPGFHGFHVHTIGSCTPDFLAAGGHLNPGASNHRDHAGDMPVLLVNADGRGELRFKTDRLTLSDLNDTNGSAIIIHADPDNYANIPARYGFPDAATLATGDAGGRIACGVINN